MLGGMADVTRILCAIVAGDPRAAAELLPLVYDELRKLAAARLAGERAGQTLQPTALVHEAYLRLVGDQQFAGRGHFFAAAAEAMRRILVEQARRKGRAKRGGRAPPPAPGRQRAGRRPPGGRPRPAGAGRGPRPPRSRLAPPGPAGRSPLLRRPDFAGGGRAAGRLAVHRRGRLDLRQGLAEAGDGKRLTIRRGFRPAAAHWFRGGPSRGREPDLRRRPE